MDQTTLGELLNLDEADLFVQLAEELQGGGRGVGPKGRDAQRRFGQRWFERWIDDNKNDICTHPAVVAVLHDKEAQSDLDDATILFDVVVPFLGGPPIATVAVLIAKRGLRRFCA